ncbi:uncharacterized protein SCODWIG_03534 [Saccharomycodes ludwigii]|uniref:Peptidase A1 domain-containing protein n=1 Tax=Saccharomycodes ludwigii TaxID=36035 RepID=A0A376BAR3_9ASCO|nr:hypothetical protein SCDLUD_001759 [Saccharomycodes ludwigii]KAH3901972.1 hypothetical protein SCDLUD_001759 [Saccharomycodes ludwigii]SSD61773.1 uncharacterized protein SCODWIG_03534 [Saccharomycodes ludwigii]
MNFGSRNEDTGYNSTVKFIQFDMDQINGNSGGSTTHADANKRHYYNTTSNYVLKLIESQESFYSIDLCIGQPQCQKVTVLLDTGSSDLWIMSHNNKYCKEITSTVEIGTNKINCNKYGTFDVNKSKSFITIPNSKYLVEYLDDTRVEGIWGIDKFWLQGGNSDDYILDLPFGVGFDSNSTVGVLGIGIPRHSKTDNKKFQITYQTENLPMRLYNKGLIEWPLYSIYLVNDDYDYDGDGVESSQILFGAVDNSKYEIGTLKTFKMINSENPSLPPFKLEIPLTNIYLGNNSISSIGDTKDSNKGNKKFIGCILDTGSTFNHFPQVAFDSLVHLVKREFGDDAIRYSNISDGTSSNTGEFTGSTSKNGPYCYLRINNTEKDYNKLEQMELKIEFSSYHNITIKLSDLLLQNIPILVADPLTSTTTIANTSISRVTQIEYIIGVFPNEKLHSIILGKLFMKKVYTIFDLKNFHISIGNVKVNTVNNRNSGSRISWNKIIKSVVYYNVAKNIGLEKSLSMDGSVTGSHTWEVAFDNVYNNRGMRGCYYSYKCSVILMPLLLIVLLLL